LLFFLVAISLSSFAEESNTNQSMVALDDNDIDIEIRNLIDDISKIYISSMVYIFKNQALINKKNLNKHDLFGEKFIDNIKLTYRKKFNEDFPKQDHFSIKMLLQSMIEVMEDNRPLFEDDEIAFKGIIPAIFAAQLSAKLSTKGIGLKIKFTRTTPGIRNKLNIPDQWETEIMKKILQNPKIYYDENSLLNGQPAYRQFTPLPMAPYCLFCHGTMADNPINKGKEKSQWTNIDMTGFPMENWTINDFGGGISISIEKSSLEHYVN
jgi:hypothetical protein